MKNRKSVVILVCLFLILLNYNNCGKTQFSGTVENSKTVGSQEVQEVIKNCENALKNGSLKTATQMINFEDTRVETGLSNICEFGQGDNLSKKDSYMRARYEQTRALNLPANAVLCDVKMTTDVQNFRYDDVFFFTFNGYLLASNNKTAVNDRLSPQPMMMSGGTMVPLFKYDWLQLRDAYFDNVADDYCIGQSQGFSSCSWPISQQNGEISLDFSKELLINLGLRVAATENKFGFIITGDNDPSDDCFHEKLEFQMQVKYYLK